MCGKTSIGRLRQASAIGAIALMGVAAQPAMAWDRIFPLHIYNADSRPVTVTISAENNNCYEGDPGLGTVFENIAPKGSVTITLARVQGHGCDGRQGEFDLAFNPGAGVRKTRHFDFDNDGGLELSTDPKWINQYPGTLSARNGKDGSYTFSTFKMTEITAGPASGTWDQVCQGICDRTLTTGMSYAHSDQRTDSTEVTNAVKAALEVGVQFKESKFLTINSKTSIETSWQKRVGEQMAVSDTHTESSTNTNNYKFTAEQMRALNIFAVWQWIATTQLSDGTQVIVRSNKFTCTPDGATPTYLPGTPDDVKACRGG